MYSDLGLSLNLLIDKDNLFKLYQDLKTAFQLDEEWKGGEIETKVEYRVLINMSFLKGKGRFRNEIPNVPG
jgi:hypothetical protein